MPSVVHPFADPNMPWTDPVGLMVTIHCPARPAMQELVRLLLAHGAHPNDMVADYDSGTRLALRT